MCCEKKTKQMTRFSHFSSESGFMLFPLKSRKLANPWYGPRDLWGPYVPLHHINRYLRDGLFFLNLLKNGMLITNLYHNIVKHESTLLSLKPRPINVAIKNNFVKNYASYVFFSTCVKHLTTYFPFHCGFTKLFP